MDGKKRGRWPLWLLAVLCAAVFAVFLWRLWYLQFPMGAEYAARAAAASSTSYTLTLPAARGAITDRDGVVLAQDTTVFDLYLAYPAPPGQAAGDTLAALQRCGVLDEQSGKDVETQLAAFSASVSSGALPVARGLGADAAAALYAAGLPQQGAVWLLPRGVRTWAEGTLLPHALGFTGPVTAAQWAADDYALRAAGVAMDADIGQSGLEAAYDAQLRGQAGLLRVRAAIGGGTAAETELVRAPAAGAALELYLDAGLQRLVQQAVEDQLAALRATASAGHGREANAGAAVVVDVHTGGILAAVSCPGYDLNTYRAQYADLAQDAAAPLLDRVGSGLYAPGSAFKPALAACALASGLITPRDTVYCGGRYTFYRGYQPQCLQLLHSGPVNVLTALRCSCNIFFYDVGRRLGVDTFSAGAQALGLAADPGAELPGAAGQLTWTTDANYQDGLALQAAIGQGNTAVTPLQLAAYAAALANDGARPALHYARCARGADGAVLWQAQPAVLSRAPGDAEVYALVREGMTRMAGTLKALRGAAVPCAAKTGSPQLARRRPGGGYYTNSVLIALAPADQPQIAVAIVLEYGGGGANAAPILRAILDAPELWMA